ncbi:Copper amine oxidase N-terminal domain-containing protein [Paenibacillus algorifonticola]|uniref:Copper amine oxidase N-terminal domain-containing protein n=1 Tax=Paenibacillus algorifonticola TaxID=684063 RepID=A0A1I2D4S6_9BACL|nr:copper amine oxidase N-terminal domain-containing protein [Paenibacillus algorifonticola]SFE75495.1 Copper amine oxidase N-terminal domain-containing protein [Paenibacillus algorifonticola]
MKPYAGKIVVLGIVAAILIPILMFTEFNYGFYQKFRFEQRAEHYLAETYAEDMKIVYVRYLWDNIEPLVAKVHPKSDPSLQFYIYHSEERELGLTDDYATTLWKIQAMEEAETLLRPVQPDYARHASIDFSCCKVSEYDFASIRGEVPHFGTTRLPFDLAVTLERAMEANDFDHMYQSVSALRESASLVLGSLVFRFPLPETDGFAVFEIPGDALNAVASAADVEAYNATRIPAQEIAERIGASLEWNEQKSEAIFTRDDTTLVVRSWGNEAFLNGEPIADPIGAYIGDSMQLMVPVWLVERAFEQKIALW